ncbi:MAG: EF-P lysine aminoacylase GenX [Candidatus Schekmanbacteria bacterium RBG_13_48_7]|uniref:EF-P lysine aminoacylase GenX n=1 Tax=Candidatus Schekmanbacteria bacterium RBG_13_48_7 TaxID=1817878 RepID=A0A1F7S804_9BACT|nr:MAG: EF-P lysine aminoacylase GenX [Candidatus Schekmanbacteria bacterium RBG_13_48_7]
MPDKKISRQYYLPTSPEFPMKRLLANGYEKIFYLGKVFRNENEGSLHLREFTMLEWYRAYADYEHIMNETMELIIFLIDGHGKESMQIQYGDYMIDMKPPWQKTTVSDAFRRAYDIDNETLTDQKKLFDFAHTLFKEINGDWSYSDIFFKLFLEKIEKNLGTARPEFIINFPLQLGALAKKHEPDPRFAERFELYIGGLEIANAYTELNDPVEQKQRFRETQIARAKLGKPIYKIDKTLIECLQYGIPPAGGIALGVDRLIMVLLNCHDIRQVVWFPPE